MTKCKNIRDCKYFLKLVLVSLKTRKNKAGRIMSKLLLKSLSPGIFHALNVLLDSSFISLHEMEHGTS